MTSTTPFRSIFRAVAAALVVLTLLVVTAPCWAPALVCDNGGC